MVLDLHSTLSLRNSGQRRVRAATLIVEAQAVTPGGRGSVSVASLNAGPGETFPVRVDLRLLRPLSAAPGPLVEISLDGVLFDDLTFFGPNKLNSRRTMMVWELEARRDRRHLRQILEAGGREGLQREILAAMSRDPGGPRLDVEVARGGRSTNVETEHQVKFSFLRLPDAPIEPMSGVATVASNEARAPNLEVRNRSDRAIRYLEMACKIRDRQGKESLPVVVPADLSSSPLAPGATGRIQPQTVLRLRDPAGGEVSIESMSGFVNSVEFADGSVWIPNRGAVTSVSGEEQRLIQVYRKKGLAALIDELNRF
jgi:hypothetical protein